MKRFLFCCLLIALVAGGLVAEVWAQYYSPGQMQMRMQLGGPTLTQLRAQQKRQWIAQQQWQWQQQRQAAYDDARWEQWAAQHPWLAKRQIAFEAADRARPLPSPMPSPLSKSWHMRPDGGGGYDISEW